MKKLTILASALLIFVVAPSCFAQDDQSPTDSQIATDEAIGTGFEQVTGLPTDATSWAIQAAEAAGVLSSEAAAGVGGFAVGFSSSYTAGPEMDEVNNPYYYPGVNDDSAVDTYLQGVQAETDSQNQSFEDYQQAQQNYLNNVAPPPSEDYLTCGGPVCTAR